MEILLGLIAFLLVCLLAGGGYLAYRLFGHEEEQEDAGPDPLELVRGDREPPSDEDFRFHRSGPEDRELVDGISQVLQIDVKVKPLAYGEYRSYDGFGQPVMQWTSDEQARLLREHLIEPDLTDELAEGEILDGETLEREFEAFEIVDLIQAVVTYSGLHRFFRKTNGGPAGRALGKLKDRMGSRARSSGSSATSTSSDTATSATEASIG